ncbi:MAG TPA: STAS domain-containing protein [Solirubrobacteraceae bacterium]|nr:STAS domain-containing protein [Solirubrobacteraceae bacterium]
MSFFYIGDDATGEALKWCDDVAVVVVGGEIDFAASPRLRECLADRVGAGKRRLVLDFSSVSFIDSTAIGVLVGAIMRLREHGEGSLSVVCPEENRRVMRIFDIAGVENLIELHYSRAEALSALALAG